MSYEGRKDLIMFAYGPTNSLTGIAPEENEEWRIVRNNKEGSRLS